MYTDSIRKVFQSNTVSRLTEVKLQAEECGYDALLFNGNVYARVNNERKWFKTCFVLSDFKVRL